MKVMKKQAFIVPLILAMANIVSASSHIVVSSNTRNNDNGVNAIFAGKTVRETIAKGTNFTLLPEKIGE